MKTKKVVKRWLKSLPDHMLQGELKVRVFTEVGELILLSVYRKGDTLMVDVGDYK